MPIDTAADSAFIVARNAADDGSAELATLTRLGLQSSDRDDNQEDNAGEVMSTAYVKSLRANLAKVNRENARRDSAERKDTVRSLRQMAKHSDPDVATAARIVLREFGETVTDPKSPEGARLASMKGERDTAIRWEGASRVFPVQPLGKR